MRELLSRVAGMFRRGHRDRELDQEMASHLEHEIDEYIRRGMSPEQARREALIRSGGLEQAREAWRDQRNLPLIENLAKDIRHGLRTLRRNPAYAAVAIVTLTLGIGANTAIFSVVNGVLLRPLAYKDPEQLTVLAYRNSGTVAAGVFLDWKAAATSFSRMGVEQYWTPNLTGGDRAEQLFGLRLSTDILTLLGVQPVLGRLFLPDEEHDGRQRALVLSHSFWQTRFATDSGVLGKTMLLDGERYSIVGVMPPGFEFTPYWANGAMFAAPLVLDALRNDRAGSSLRAFARLAPGVTLEQARSEMTAAAARLEKQFPGTNQNVTVTPLHEVVIGNVKPALATLLAGVGFVLLIACANVAHLQLVRAAARDREFAVRGALGASRARIVQQSLVESALLSLAGGALGLLLALGGVRLLIALAPPSLPRITSITMSASVFVFTLVATVLAGLVFGAAPAFKVSRVPLHDALKEGGRGAAESVRQRRARGALVVSQFALALVLLVGAGLVMRSFFALLAVDPGFDPRRLLTMQVSVTGTEQSGPARRASFFRELVDRVGALPGVDAVGAINHVPLNGDNWYFPFAVEGRQLARPGERARAAFLVVRPGYFRAMGIPIVRGRELTPEDETGAAHLVVVNESMARRHWPNEDPIGKRISVDDPATQPEWFTVVGIARDVRQASWTDLNSEQMYFPYLQDTAHPERAMSLLSFLHPNYMTLVVRTSADPVGMVKTIQTLVASIDRDAPVTLPLTMERAIANQFAAPRFYLALIGAFAAVALALAAVGVYGVISYTVARRAHEIGVRMALGAARRQVFGMIVGQGMRLAAIGLTLGLVFAFALTRYIGTLLFRVPPTDPATFLVVAVLLGAVALVACGIPARSALNVAPTEALRSE